MNDNQDHLSTAIRFTEIAREFCAAIDFAHEIDRTAFLVRIYRILPRLIGEAIELPALNLSDEGDEEEDSTSTARKNHQRLTDTQWNEFYELLKEKFGDWTLYLQVFDPTKDKEAIFGSLADDLADIYRDLKKVLTLREDDHSPVQNALWQWRFDYYVHRGHHAINALNAIHSRLEDLLAEI